MALNLELKIKVSSHDDMIKRINENGGKCISTLIQKDTYYKFDKGSVKIP